MAETGRQKIRPDDLARRLRQVGGRDRLDAELFRVARDLIAPFEDELTAAERAWLEERIGRAIQVTIEPALALFLSELAESLTAAPDELVAHVSRARLRAEIGGE